MPLTSESGRGVGQAVWFPNARAGWVVREVGFTWEVRLFGFPRCGRPVNGVGGLVGSVVGMIVGVSARGSTGFWLSLFFILCVIYSGSIFSGLRLLPVRCKFTSGSLCKTGVGQVLVEDGECWWGVGGCESMFAVLFLVCEISLMGG